MFEKKSNRSGSKEANVCKLDHFLCLVSDETNRLSHYCTLNGMDVVAQFHSVLYVRFVKVGHFCGSPGHF